MSTQNIINVCLAICTTFLIYQNTQLKDDIKSLKSDSRYFVSQSEAENIANYEARRVAENCTVSGYVDRGGWANNLTILC